MYLSASSKAILYKWYRLAQDRVRKRGGRTSGAAQISDDDENDDLMLSGFGRKRLRLNAASTAIAIKWLRLARTRIQHRGGGGGGPGKKQLMGRSPPKMGSGMKSRFRKK